MRGLLSWAVLIFSVCSTLQGQVWLEETQLDTQTVATGLEIPWDLERWNTDTLIFTERTGAIKRLALNTGKVDTLCEVQDLAIESQSGLMGLQLHPDFPSVPSIFVAYSYYVGTDIRMRVERFEYDAVNDTLLADAVVVDDIPSSNTNIGGRMLVTANNELFLTVGDAKESSLAQMVGSAHGKVHRFHLDGTIPNDNPIPNNSLYTFGHRNPQGLAITGDGHLFISEHGPSSDDELNLLEPERNYGWPAITGTCNAGNQSICDSLNMMEPLVAWSPTIAPAGIEYCNLSTIPEWENSLLVASLKEQRLFIVNLNASVTEAERVSWILTKEYGRLRDVLIADGHVFMCTSNRDALGEPTSQDDRIIKLIPSMHNAIGDVEAAGIDYHIESDRIVLHKPFTGTIAIYDMMGRMHRQAQLRQETDILFSNPTPGIRCISLETDRTRHTLKVYRP